jgi:ABC-type branched-subunit amino acid transport system substrate-binding protein
LRKPKLSRVLLAFSLLVTVAACGSRLSDEERALVLSSGGSGGEAVGGLGEVTDVTVADDVTVDTASPDQVEAGGGGADPAAAGGGGGEAGGPSGEGGGDGACRPGSATGPGVSPTEITVGNVSQLSGLVPGFGQTGINGAKAYLNMVNSQGGVCGRQIKMVVADDRFQSATNRSETEKMADKVLALVGSVSVVDDGGAPVIDAKGIPDVSLATTKVRVAAKNNFSPNPIDPNPQAGNGLAGILEYFKQTEGIKKPAIFYQNVATGVNQANSYKIDFQRAGIPVADENVYAVSPTATNFNTEANHMKSTQVDFVITVAEVNTMANLARSFESVGYFPKVPFYGAQVYGKKFLQLAGKAAEGTKVGLIFAIPEEAGGNQAMAQFNEWYARTAPGQDVDFFALVGWVAADMFVHALRAAGPDPTQAKVIAELSKLTSYDAHGAVGNINPAQKKNTGCYHVIAVEGGKWVKKHPAKGFAC